MKHIVISLGIFSLCSTGYAAVDLVCEAILEPLADYVLADSAIVPKLKITNLGDQGASNFWVKLIIDEVSTGETVYVASTKIGYIGANPATIEVEMLEWAPEGNCEDADPNGYGPFVDYELLGIPEAAFDTDQTNDTCYEEVTALLEHDVGVVEMEFDPYPNLPPDLYVPGTEVIVTATVENFGYRPEADIPVRLEILDKCADPDTLVYHNIQPVKAIGWRGDSITGIYTARVVFPRWVVSHLSWFTPMCKTEMKGDECPDDDFTVWNVNYYSEPDDPCSGLSAEEHSAVETTSLEEPLFKDGTYIINYSLPLFSWLRLDLYDASGRFVRNLYNDPCSAGRHTITWDGKDSKGHKVSSGAYFVRMETGGESITSKFLNIR
ncbi:hypothetical protein GX441_03705 [bacterium]|nr:hypothetical protein [bacterium]